MKTAIVVLVILVVVHAALFGKKKEEDSCKDNEPEYCKEKVPKGFCESQFHTLEQKKAKCMKSCKMCCDEADPKCKPKGPYDDYAIPVSERQPWV
ncbi:hypothetical protein COOONC_23792 [Cooperia oncophora]